LASYGILKVYRKSPNPSKLSKTKKNFPQDSLVLKVPGGFEIKVFHLVSEN
jgi:hypothetical protein